MTMKIILAGCNLDCAAISALKTGIHDKTCLTPETIAAAYARISRDPRPVNELRKIAMAEVEKARQSNRNIAFTMGHSSIAEHAVFNIDVLGVSRLLVEEIERSRLVSYTEKSQRYVLLENDFVVPQEIKEVGLESSFTGTIREQNVCYHKIYDRLRSYIFEKHKEMAEDRSKHSLLEGCAKEDARYVISLATETQLGMTINARSLELLIRRLASSPLSEAREASRRFYEVAVGIAPSLIRYVEPTDHDRLTRGELREKAGALKAKLVNCNERGGTSPPSGDDEVVLIHATADADIRIVAALLHSTSDLSLGQCMEIACQMTDGEKEEVIKTALRHIRSYDAVLREFENVDLHFELTVSSTCFAQLKRHRMATIICQDYDPGLGVTVPPAIREAGLENDFTKIMSRTEETYFKIKKVSPAIADYILTNAHRRRVSLKVNARELYHIIRLRGDQHAQWDIRQAVKKMTELGRKSMPLTLILATGKDSFDPLYAKIYCRGQL
jgi:flavin-dependent thymidylate synthase